MTPFFLHARALAAAGLALLACGAAQAQYKVVNPDGSVTYTDRPPVASNVRVTNLGRPGAPGLSAADVNLPPDLRTAVQRYPVVLYTSADCAPCDAGRRLLIQRGVPFSERRATSDEDVLALERIVGGRTVPALTVGAQPLRGLSETDWAAYLDAAGYPKENKLPRGWQPPEPQPVVERASPPPRAAIEARPAPEQINQPIAPPPSGTTIRF